jgi:hypothetical protein
MSKKNEEFFVNLGFSTVKMAGIVFPPKIPKAVPELWKEDFEKSPAFAKVDSDKELQDGDVAKLHKSEKAAALSRRRAWREEYLREKRKELENNGEVTPPVPMEPEPVPPPEPPSTEGTIKKGDKK